MASQPETQRARLRSLVEKPPKFRLNSAGYIDNDVDIANCGGWLTSAINLVVALVPYSQNPYRDATERMRSAAAAPTWTVHRQVLHMKDLLQRLEMDIDAGLIIDMQTRVSAETFDEMLDHAQAYLNEGRAGPAGVLAGVIFEDTIRKLCEKNRVKQRNEKLDSLLAALGQKGVLTALERKEGIAAARVRNKAAHAQWDEFNGEQVDAVIRFTHRLIREKLAR